MHICRRHVGWATKRCYQRDIAECRERRARDERVSSILEEVAVVITKTGRSADGADILAGRPDGSF